MNRIEGEEERGSVPARLPFPAGVVEGFYGPAWTHAQRLWTIGFIASLGMNTYIYAPKNDPFHRERWRDDYPEKTLAAFSELAGACTDSGILFRYALSPGLSITYSDRAEKQRLVDKLLKLSDRGIKAFCLFLDDIPPRLAGERDREAFASLASAQADLVNGVAEDLHARLGAVPPLYFCPTEYAWTTPSPYLETMGRELLPDIGIFWTGPQVVSRRITGDDARRFLDVVGRKPLLWDNFPVNDFAPNRLFLSPLLGRDRELCREVSGYFSNPMNQALASSVALRTVARFLHDPEEYDAQTAWVSALRKTAPAGLEREFLLAALMFEPSRLCPDLTTSLSRASLKEKDPPLSVAALLAREIRSAVEKLLAAKAGSPLIKEISGWLHDTELRCRTVLGAADAAEALRNGERERAEKIARKTWSHRCLAGRSQTMASSEEIRKAEEILVPLVRRPGKPLFEETEPAPGADAASVVVDAGSLIRTGKIAALWGRPWQSQPPDEEPAVALSTDGLTYRPLEFEESGSAWVAVGEEHAFRYVKVTGRAAWHLFLLALPH